MSEASTDQDLEKITEPDLTLTLTSSERSLRDRFVEEYLTDYDAYQACIRVGYTKMLAKKFCAIFMQEPYTLQRIRLRETGGAEVEEDSAEARKRRVMMGLIREANYRGPGCSQAARVAALSKLAAIEGMDAPKKSIHEMTGPDGQPISQGGFFVVPGIMTTEDWEKRAAEQQAALVAQVPAGSAEAKVD